MKFVDENDKFLLCVNTRATEVVREQLGPRMISIAPEEFKSGRSNDPLHRGYAQHCTEFYNRSSVNVSLIAPHDG